MPEKDYSNYRNNEFFPTLLTKCRELRKNQTNAERLLWALLRNRQIDGLKFRRQHQFGSFILDFFCAEKRLAIEVDGGQHYKKKGQRKDYSRNLYLKKQDIRVIRFSNVEVLKETEAVLLKIWQSVFKGTENDPHPNPLPEGEGLEFGHLKAVQE